TITAVLPTGPTHGTLVLHADGSFVYTPDKDYNGADSFTYQASDGELTSTAATVTITIRPVNDAPVATDDSYTTVEDGALGAALPGVLINDSDIDSPAITAVLVAGPSHGVLTLNPNGGFVYSPAKDYNGDDSFTYQATDGDLLSNVAIVSLTITPVNDAPAAADDNFTTAEDAPLAIDAP